MKKVIKQCKEWLNNNVLKKPPVTETTIEVQTKQIYGTYNMIVTDKKNRSYDIGIGAILCGSNISKEQWQNTMESIGKGTMLKLSVRTVDFEDNSVPALTALKATVALL